MLITYLIMHTSACKGEHMMVVYFYMVRFIMHSLVEYGMCLNRLSFQETSRSFFMC